MSARRRTSSNLNEEHPKVFTSKPIPLDISKLENEFYRADLELYDLDHEGPSYEGRVFLNNPKANQKTSTTLKNGYVGSFFVFGHGGRCYGDVGHCEVPAKTRFYDLRRSHPLTPLYKQVMITEGLKIIGKKNDKISVTIVPIVRGPVDEIYDIKNLLKFKWLMMVTYD